MATQTNPNALKHWFGKDLLERMGKSIREAYPLFNQERLSKLHPKLKTLEMKPRVQLIRQALHSYLPQDYPKALCILLESARSGRLNGFDLWPYSDFIQNYGLSNVDLSLQALRELTPSFSSEFAIRPFLINYPDKTIPYLEQCALDPNLHVRRWASEGTRPRLPWGERLHAFIKTPSITSCILEHLKFDPEQYVRKSVANHLNDIAKDHPKYVLSTLSDWQKIADERDTINLGWMVRHALRTLIKEGNPKALQLIDVSAKAKIQISNFRVNQRVLQVGEYLEFEFKLQSLASQPQKLVIDYLIHFMKANARHSPKVFKLKEIILPGRSEVAIRKKHHMKQITTRTYYPGAHLLELQINGKKFGQMDWTLKKNPES